MVNARDAGLPPARQTIKLASGIALRVDGEPSRSMLLLRAAGKVHLNRHALAILELCDGSRSRDRIIVDAMLRAPGTLRADVVEFLEAALSRGWIVEGG